IRSIRPDRHIPAGLHSSITVVHRKSSAGGVDAGTGIRHRAADRDWDHLAIGWPERGRRHRNRYRWWRRVDLHLDQVMRFFIAGWIDTPVGDVMNAVSGMRERRGIGLS